MSLDLTGKKYNNLLVIEKTRKNNRVYWKCLCDCGNEHVVRSDFLLVSKTVECQRCPKKPYILTQLSLINTFEYNPDSGEFKRIEKTSKTMAGCLATYKTKRGYLTMSIKRKSYYAHRLAFLYMIGEMPEQVDHINHIKDDNRWCNLRKANYSINTKNRSMQKINTSGVVGVAKSGNKWRAKISDIELGIYKNKNDAIIARKMAEKDLGYHQNHGDAL